MSDEPTDFMALLPESVKQQIEEAEEQEEVERAEAREAGAAAARRRLGAAPQPTPEEVAAQLPDFDGETYEHDRDHLRLGKQALRVWNVLKDGQWHTLAEIAGRTGDPEASVSARIRDLRKQKFGGREVERHNIGGGLWCYRLKPPS